MKLIEPKVELMQQAPGLVGMYKHIEKCARTCYKSEDNITEDSYKKIYDNLVKRGHLTMLEHGTVYLYLEINSDNCTKTFDYPSGNFTGHYNWADVVGRIYAKYNVNPYSKVNTTFTKDNMFIREVYVTTNLRVIIENHWEDDLKFICEPTEFHERRITLKFTTNIGVTREANRHRTFPQPEEFSVAEESTRYCNYSNANKFGEDITFIKPTWISWGDLGEDNDCKELILKDAIGVYSVDKQAGTYLDSLIQSEEAYKELINLGWSPQQAREVLPLATKTQLIHTAFVDDWKHFFALRADGVSGPPHPNAKLVAEPLKQEFIKRGYI